MSTSDDRLREVLAAWYEAREAGRSVDLVELCGGDEALAAVARRMLDDDPLRDSISGPRGAPERDAGADAAPPVERLGPYRLRVRIGEGGMGQVYLAEQTDLERLVAVKILRTDGRVDPKARQRLEREAKLASSLDHPNIVPVHAVDEQDGLLYVVMKWLSGPGLEHLVGRLTTREAAGIAARIARALDEAHACGVLHRDVKPANVILDRGTPYLVDFGLARDLGSPLSRSQEIAGTLAYMAPEQLGDDQEAVDARSDVYALGATLFELVTGRRLCGGETARGLLSAALLRDTLPVRFDRRERDLEAIVQRAVSPDPGDRFPTAGAFADDLERYLRGEPVESRPLGPATVVWRKVRRRPRTSAALAAVVLLALSASVVAAVEAARSRSVLASVRSDVRSALDRGELREARTELDRLARETTPTARDRALREELDARGALETLLDQLMSTWETQPLRLLEELVEDVRAAGTARFEPWRTGVALALASLHLDDGAALGRLDRLDAEHGPTRATAALRALAERREEIPREVPAAGPLDDVVTFLALRMAYAPLADRKAEIDAAADAWSDDFRVGLAEVMHHVDAGEFDFAYRLLRKLPEPARETPRLSGARAHILILCGRLEEAEQELGRTPHDFRTGWDVTNRLTIRWLREEYDELTREVGRALERFPDDGHVRMFAARYSLWTGDEARAREELSALAGGARMAAHRAAARGMQLVLSLNGVFRLPASERARAAAELRDEAQGFLDERPRLPEARAHAYHVVAETTVMLVGESMLDDERERRRVLGALRSAIEADETSVVPRLAFCRVVQWFAAVVASGASAGGESMERDARALCHEARGVIRGVFDDDQRRKLPVSRSEEMQAWSFRLDLAERLGDSQAVRAGLEELEMHAPLPWSEEKRAWFEELRDRFAGGA